MSGQLDYSIILEHLRSLFSVYHIAGCTLHVTHLNVISQIELTACHNILLFICLQTLAVNKKSPLVQTAYWPAQYGKRKKCCGFQLNAQALPYTAPLFVSGDHESYIFHARQRVLPCFTFRFCLHDSRQRWCKGRKEIRTFTRLKRRIWYVCVCLFS